MGLALLAAGLDSAAATAAPAPRRPPNLVLIIIDTLRADALGVYGQSESPSPEIDAYAREGVRFARVVAQCTWTRPSIGSLLTSLHPRTLGLYREEGQTLAERFTTLAEVLRANGYRTLGATANPTINAYFNFDQGFDTYFDSQTVFDFMPGAQRQTDSAQAQAFPSARAIFLKLQEAIRQRVGVPTYVQVNLMEVHQYTLRRPNDGGEGGTAGGSLRAQYLDAVREVSREIDLFIRSLTRQPGWRDALFVITSDHGETFPGNHRGVALPKWHGFLVYETQTLVPWILYSESDDLPAGRVIERPVRLLDLMPTLLDYAGVPAPEGMAGLSLLPWLRDPAGDVAIPDRFVVETEFRDADKSAVYAGEWIYVENRDGHPGTLPRELQRAGAQSDGGRTDLTDRYPAEAEEQARFLEQWRLRHPRSEPTAATDAPEDAMVEQLRALGYVQ